MSRPRSRTGWRRSAMAAVAAACLALAACGDKSADSPLEAGRAALAKKDFVSARIHLKDALQRQPQSAEARYLLGRALLDSGDPRGASVELMRAMDARWNDKLVLPALARSMLLSGQVKKLTEAYDQVTLDDPAAQADLKATLANAWGILGDKAHFEASVQAALAAKPDLPAVKVVQARVAVNAGRVDEALGLLDQALKSDPGSYEAWFLKGQLLSYAKNDPAGGEAAYRKTLAIEQAYVPAHAAIVELHLRKQDIAGAKEQAAQLRKVLPKHPHSVFIDAQIALLDNDPKRARELTQALLKWAPDSAPVLQLAGAVEAQLGSQVLAEAHYAKALQVNPGLALARRNLARLYVTRGQATRALHTIEPLIAGTSTDAEAFAIAGDAQLQLGDTQGAEASYTRATKLRPEEGQYRTTSALFRLARGDADSAFAQLEAIAADPKDSSAAMAIISARLKRHEFDLALKAMDALIAKQPKSASLLELRGRILAQRKDNAGARASYEKALAMEPRLFAATLSLARLDQAEGKTAEARKRLQSAIEADPRNAAARIALADLTEKSGGSLDDVRSVLAAGVKAGGADPTLRIALVEVLLRKKQFKDALSEAQEALAAFPNDAEVLDTLGRTQMLSGDMQQAVSTFRTLANVEPTSVRAHMRAADAYGKLGNRDGAIASLRRALEIDPQHPSAQASLVDLLIAGGKPKEALEYARSMQARQPELAMGYLLEGAIHIRQKDWDAATAVHRKGLERAPGRSELAVALHTSLSAGGRSAEAEKFAETWLRQHPGDADFGYRVAQQYLVRGRLAEAEERFMKLATQRPNDGLVLNNLAWVIAAQGKPGAVPYAERAAELLPNRSSILDTLALALANEKQYPRALATQRKAIEVSPTDMGLRLNLARIAIQAGDKPLAKTELERLGTLGPKSPLAAEVSRLQKLL